MLNQLVVVGRLTHNPEVKELENGTKESVITLAVQRSYKNKEGIYDTDFISFKLSDEVTTKTAEYCKKGDIVGIKGVIQSKDNQIELIGNKVTFLTSNKEILKNN